MKKLTISKVGNIGKNGVFYDWEFISPITEEIFNLNSLSHIFSNKLQDFLDDYFMFTTYLTGYTKEELYQIWLQHNYNIEHGINLNISRCLNHVNNLSIAEQINKENKELLNGIY
jgi:hypothetical protein